MAELLLLLETAVGKAILAKFASVAHEAEAAMRFRIISDGAFTREFLKTVARVNAALAAEAV
jgi:hypothetical protein